MANGRPRTRESQVARSPSPPYLSPMPSVTLAPGVTLVPGYLDRAAQDALLAAVRAVIAAAPLYVPRMPRSGKPMSVMMTNCGPLGWVTDAERGYRYQPVH
ncbi:MAG: oxidative demethylase, partial [Hyphomicrobiales bacterium]|nr:oxidative demethylase [Hyphomicrobiales bacterium]